MAGKNKEQEQTLDLEDIAAKNSSRVKQENIKLKAIGAEDEGFASKVKVWGLPLLFIIVGILIVWNVWLLMQIKQLNHTVDHTYVYNMEAVLMQTGLADENRHFEANMADLEKEIDAAEKKVKSMKDKKLQGEYREMYMKSLTLKRDNLVEEHEKFMKTLLKNINKTLMEVAKDKNVKVIFSNKAVVFSTNYVTDVTPIVAQKLKQKMEE